MKKNTEISQMFVDCDTQFLQSTGAFMLYIKEKLSALFGQTLTFGKYKEQLNWNVINREDKRAFLIIDEKGLVVVVCQDKLNPSQKQYLGKTRDYLDVDFGGTKENTFNLKMTSDIDKIIVKLEDHFCTRS